MAGRSRAAACAAWRDSLPPGGALIYLDSEVDRAVALHRRTLPANTPHIDGEVLVRFVVAPDGRADWETYAVLHSTHRTLEAYAEELVTASVFAPAVLDGQPVRQCIVLPIGFTADR